MFSGLRSLFRRHAETQEQTATRLSAHPLRSCVLDRRFALCHLTDRRRAANATQSAIVTCILETGVFAVVRRNQKVDQNVAGSTASCTGRYCVLCNKTTLRKRLMGYNNAVAVT